MTNLALSIAVFAIDNLAKKRQKFIQMRQGGTCTQPHLSIFTVLTKLWYRDYLKGESLFSNFQSLIDARPERVPVSSYDALLEQASQYSQQALIGFELGRHIQLADYGVLGYLVETCDTLQQALHALCRYDALVADIGRVKFDSDGDDMAIVWHLNTAVGKQIILRNMTAWVSAARQVLKSPLAPSGLSLSFALTDSERQQLSDWFGCDMRLSAERNALTFPAIT